MKNKFSKSEVIGFLEYLVLHQEANKNEMEMYEDMIWNNVHINELKKHSNTYKKMKKKMRKIYNEGV